MGKNGNVNEDMLEILTKFQTYLSRKPNGKYEAQLFAGDQLSVERAVNLTSSVANGYTPEDRFEGTNLQLGDWHAGLKKVWGLLISVNVVYTSYIPSPTRALKIMGS